VPNKHTKQLHSKNSAQFYVVRPIHAAPAIPAYHKRLFACTWPPNGQTAKNRAKPSPPSRSLLNLSPEKKFPRPNGLSRRARLSHEVLPTKDPTAHGQRTAPGRRRPGRVGCALLVTFDGTCELRTRGGRGSNENEHPRQLRGDRRSPAVSR
jgi:hypothetical protein